MRLAMIVTTAVALSAGLAAAGHSASTLEQLLDRATVHVESVVTRLTRVVAEEQYVQEYLVATPEGSRGTFKGAPRVAERRRLTSDVLLVKLPELEQWLVFRDVSDVDGNPVRDRQNRLMKLFVESRDTVAAVERALQIAAESARFNIKQIGTVDNPLLALGFLQQAYRPRFRFAMRGRDTSAGSDAWMVEYRETQRPSIIRTGGDKDIFARGRYWLEGASGRIIRTEVSFIALGTESTITTEYAVDERLQTSVPTEMRFKRGTSNNEVRGVATYGSFRQFEVATSDAMKK
jgi:hypothetical protein